MSGVFLSVIMPWDYLLGSFPDFEFGHPRSPLKGR